MSPITDKQERFIRTLEAERGIDPMPTDNFDTRTASSYISDLLAKPKQTVASNSTPTGRQPVQSLEAITPGVYQTPDGIFVVKQNRDKTRCYAKQLVESPPRMTEAGTVADFELVYASGAIYQLAESDRMPLEDAKALTTRYGRCINCGRPLKAAKSVEEGIGPVCRKAFA